MKKTTISAAIILSRIRAMRTEKGIKQEVMADYLDLSRNAYQKIESGITTLTADHIIAIADTLGVQPNVFWQEEDELTTLQIMQAQITELQRNMNYIIQLLDKPL